MATPGALPPASPAKTGGVRYIARAPLIQVSCVDGSFAHVYRGQGVPSNADPSQLARLVEQGYVYAAPAKPQPTDDRQSAPKDEA